jgi:NAD(P)-dependent dehydrogenase (short-subunit alcohol dehydrogenase family)
MSQRRIVVSGAASGIGAAVLRELVAASHHVIAVDRNAVDAAEYVACDLSNEASIARSCAAIEGPLDGIAHVAGVPGTLPAETVLTVNYLGAKRLIETLAPKLADDASVVVVSSLAAGRCGWETARLREILAITDWRAALDAIGSSRIEGGEAYEISKRLMLAYLPLAVAGGAVRRIRVNAVSPGPVETPILGDFQKSMGTGRIEAARAMVGRHARAEEIAAAILFFLDPASSWVNGANLTVDGGLTALREAAILGNSSLVGPRARD